jgi:AraC-like DNA-binding protein
MTNDRSSFLVDNITSARGTGRALAEARDAIRQMGPLAHAKVVPAAMTRFGHWLDWPDWLLAGTDLQFGNAAQATRVSAAEELLMVANIIENDAAVDLLSRIAAGQLLLLGPVTLIAHAHAPTLGDFIRFLPRVANGSTPYGRYLLAEGPETCQLVFRSQYLIGSMLAFVGLVASLTSARALMASVPGQELELTVEAHWPRHRGGDMIAAGFPSCTIWNAEWNRLTFPAHWMHQANPGHDAGMWLLAQERLRETELAQRLQSEIARVRSRVATILTNERRVPPLNQVAGMHGMSERRLGRLLAAADTSFKTIIDDERRSRAAVMIIDPALSLKDMADLLGFRDVSSLAPSFRRWFGETPGKMRRGFQMPEQ